MWKTVKGVLGQIFSSKKALAAITGGIVALTAKFGWNVSTDMVAYILGFVGTYIIGQSIADSGKEAAKVVAESEKAS
jgi:hypothetical protein